MQNRTSPGADGAERLLELAAERLGEFGVTLERVSPDRADGGADAVVILSRGDTSAEYAVEVKVAMTLTSLASGRPAGDRPLLVVGNRVNRRSADSFREAGIQFVDTRGNAFVTFAGVFVDVRGRVDSTDQPGFGSIEPTPRQSTNLFSRVRAQVILALLTWPELAGGRRREIANAAGTSLGQAQDTLTQLGDAGFLVPRSAQLRRSDELLDLWGAAYPTGLGPRLTLARFHGDPARPLKSSAAPVYLSGESAAGVDIARPSALTVYLDSMDPELVIANRWSANPDRISNVFIRHKFWKSPRPAEEDPKKGAQNAPWPLVYADLLATGDPRLAEVARTWRADRARSDQG